jgi:hypothetical protein
MINVFGFIMKLLHATLVCGVFILFFSSSLRAPGLSDFVLFTHRGTERKQADRLTQRGDGSQMSNSIVVRSGGSSAGSRAMNSIQFIA